MRRTSRILPAKNRSGHSKEMVLTVNKPLYNHILSPRSLFSSSMKVLMSLNWR